MLKIGRKINKKTLEKKINLLYYLTTQVIYLI